VDAQAQTLADTTMASTGSLVGTYDEIQRQFREDGLDVRVRDRALARADADATRRRQAVESERKSALSEALEWTAQGSPLTPVQHANLEATGQLWKYEAIMESGGNVVTSGFGFHALHTATAEDLLQFKSPDEVWNHYRTEMDNDALPRMVAKWHAAHEAAGNASMRSADQQQKDLVNARFDDEAEYYYMRLPESDPNWTEIPKDRAASVTAWKRSYRLEVNRLGREKGAKEATTEVYREAFDSLMDKQRRANVTIDGKPVTLGALTPGEMARASVQLGPEVARKLGSKQFDVRLATPDRLVRARQALVDELQFEPTEQMVYSRAAEFVAEENQAQRDVVLSANARGEALMAERVRSALDNPDMLKKAWRAANAIEGGGGYATPSGYVSKWDGQVIEPSREGIDRALQEQMMDAFGWKLADEFGIERDAMWDRIGVTMQAMRISKAKQAGQGAGWESRYDTPTPVRRP